MYQALEENMLECAGAPGSAAPDMGLAPGGMMEQEICADHHDFKDWKTDTFSRCFVHLTNSLVWRSVTKEEPPTTPPTAVEYTSAGLPWFEYYDDSKVALEGGERQGPSRCTFTGFGRTAHLLARTSRVIIDFHNHYFPPLFLDAIREGPSNFRITEDDAGNPVLHSPGDYNVLVPGHRDLAHRAQVLEEAGVDMQVITFTAPGTSIETPARAAELASIVNDGLAAGRDEWPERFTTLGHLPLNNPEAAVRELERGVIELGFKGFMLLSNASGVPLADERFEPLYERADHHGVVFYIHPTYPLGVEAMEDYMLMPLVGFLFDTTLATAHLVYAGVPERYPNIRWVLCHTGGAIPFLAERLDRGYEAFPRCRERISELPSEYLKRFYYDTVNFDPKALRLAVDFAGVDQIVAGSDYPHMIGSLDKMKSTIAALGLSAEDEAKVLGKNAARLLSL